MTRTLAGVLCAVATIGAGAIAGCGGSSSDASSPATTPAETTPTTAAASDTAAAPASSAARTPLGTTLKLGRPAVVVYDDSESHKKATVKLTPSAIEQGTISDFKNIKLEAAQKTSTPFYVKVTAANVGKVGLPGKASPATYVNGVDDRDQNQNEVIFFGDFPRCEAKTPKSFKPGDSYTTCLTFLIPKGGSLKGMRWIAFDEKSGKSNIDWK